MAAIVARTV